MFALLGSTAAFSQQPPPGMQVGMLTCNLAPSIGLIVAESQRMSCRFVPNGPHPPQTYSGVMNTVGLELGVTAAGVMAWGVFAPSQGTPMGALAFCREAGDRIEGKPTHRHELGPVRQAIFAPAPDNGQAPPGTARGPAGTGRRAAAWPAVVPGWRASVLCGEARRSRRS